MKPFNLKLFVLLFLSYTTLFATWGTITGGRGNFTTDPDFHLLYGGAGTTLFGDFNATGNSILSSNNPTNANLITDITTYKTVDANFNTSIYSLNDSEKMNSSSAEISLPSYVKGSDIVWAGLFWQGHIYRQNGAYTDATIDTDTVGWNRITIKDSNGTMHPITAPIGNNDTTHKAFYHTITSGTGYRHHYGGYYDVTSILQNSYTSGQNTYTVGNIKTTAGQDNGGYVYITQAPAYSDDFRFGLYGGWSLIVAYNVDGVTALANSVPLKNISIYDGFDLFLTWGPGTVPFETTIDVSGFYTPKSGTVNSKLLLFAGAGDRGIGDDTLQIQNQDNIGSYTNLFNTANSVSQQFNHSYSYFGTHLTPGDTNKQGMDLDIFDVSSQIGNGQSETKIKFGVVKSGGHCDQLFPQVIAFSTELYQPQLCYDYSYSQYGRFVTEENNGTAVPRLVAKSGSFIAVNEPVNVKFFIRNEENSDAVASDVKFNLLDINSSQADYTLGTTQVSVANSSTLHPFTDDGNTTQRQITNVYNSTIGSKEFFYTSFDLNPLVHDINISLNAQLDYKIQFYDENNLPVLTAPIEYTGRTLGSQNIQLCADAGAPYSPTIGQFNIVHDRFYNSFTSGTVGGTYNLPTQVVNRNGNFHIIATDTDTTLAGNARMDKLKSTVAIVGVEIIDAGGWQDTDTACDEDSTRRSHIVWIGYDGNVTNAILNNTVLNTQCTNNTDTNCYIFVEHPDSGGANDVAMFSTAIESAAFRIVSFADIDGTSPHFKQGSSRGWYLDNFTEYAGTECLSDPDLTNPASATETVSHHCGDNSGHGIYPFDKCVKCIMGDNIQRTCSRDNFAIRPEAFLLSIQDQNQTDLTALPKPILIESNTTAASSTTIPLASGYSYELNATAVTHTDNEGSRKYRKSFFDTTDNSDTLIYTWVPTADDTKCNDINNSDMDFSFTGDTGTGTKTDSLLDQVGTYILSMTDEDWTLADQDPSHHYESSYNFTSGTNQDCSSSLSTVPAQSSTNAIGCKISSTHSSLDTVRTFVNPTVEFHPYQFALNTNVTLGLNNNPYDTLSSGNNFVYINNINNASDENMSVQFNTNITAQGQNNIPLTNFVAGCYAKPLDINISRSNTISTSLVQRYINRDLNVTGIGVSATIDPNTNHDINITTPSTYFVKGMNGVLNTVTTVNFDRNGTAQNPENINFNTITVVDPRTNIKADLTDINASGESNVTTGQVNTSINYFYGRTASKKTTIICDTSTANCNSGGTESDVFIYYEVFCNGTLNGNTCNNALLPTDVGGNTHQKTDRRWFISLDHNTSKDGLLTSSQDSVNAAYITFPNGLEYKNNYTLDSVHRYQVNNGLPYTAVVDDNVSAWLIYDENNASAIQNNHTVIFRGKTEWSGVHEDDSTTKTDRVRRVNRRTMW